MCSTSCSSCCTCSSQQPAAKETLVRVGLLLLSYEACCCMHCYRCQFDDERCYYASHKVTTLHSSTPPSVADQQPPSQHVERRTYLVHPHLLIVSARLGLEVRHCHQHMPLRLFVVQQCCHKALSCRLPVHGCKAVTCTGWHEAGGKGGGKELASRTVPTCCGSLSQDRDCKHAVCRLLAPSSACCTQTDLERSVADTLPPLHCLESSNCTAHTNVPDAPRTCWCWAAAEAAVPVKECNAICWEAKLDCW